MHDPLLEFDHSSAESVNYDGPGNDDVSRHVMQHIDGRVCAC